MEIQSLGLDLFTGRKGDHHVVDDIMVLRKRAVPRAEDPLVRTHHRIVGHIVHLCIDIFFLIATSENGCNITLLVFACIF